MIRPYFSTAYPVNSDDARAVSFLRTHMGPSEILYVRSDMAEPYAAWGGLPTQVSAYPAESGDDDEYGLGKDKFAARRGLANISETWFDQVLAEGISWVVTDAKDARLNAIFELAGGAGQSLNRREIRKC